MNEFTKINLIALLDAEFDKAVFNMIKHQQSVETSTSFREVAYHATEAANLEEYTQDLFNLALQILEE